VARPRPRHEEVSTPAPPRAEAPLVQDRKPEREPGRLVLRRKGAVPDQCWSSSALQAGCSRWLTSGSLTEQKSLAFARWRSFGQHAANAGLRPVTEPGRVVDAVGGAALSRPERKRGVSGPSGWLAAGSRGVPSPGAC